MTRDEILNMPAGPEMDALVAEYVMRWYLATDVDGEYEHIYWADWSKYVDAHLGYICAYQEDDDAYEDEEDMHTIYWHPSLSILWAMETENKIYDDGMTVSYINNLHQIVLQEEEVVVTGGWRHWFLIAHAAPDQRCRAALLAVMENK